MASSEQMKNSQIVKLILIACLLIATPLLSSSLRSTYLYFIVNILILALGAEAGLVSFFSEDKQSPPSSSPVKPHAIVSELSQDDHDHIDYNEEKTLPCQCSSGDGDGEEEKKTMIEPSIFFIEEIDADDGGGDGDGDDGEMEEVALIGGQELFQKAEMFIGDFYKQLKMQREESWNKLHHLCNVQYN